MTKLSFWNSILILFGTCVPKEFVSIWVTLLQFDIVNYLAMCLLEVHNYLENTSVLVKKKKIFPSLGLVFSSLYSFTVGTLISF